MKVSSSIADRRSCPRHGVRIPLRIRLWKSGIPEQKSVSNNLSLSGALFPTGLPVELGTIVELRLEMPEEISGEHLAEWRCSGHVVRIDLNEDRRRKKGVAVQFDCYEVARLLNPAALPLAHS